MSISFCIHSHVLILFERLQEVATDKGPWAWLSDKSNASKMQKHIVPWLIAMYGLGYAKAASNTVVRQMVIAISAMQHTSGPKYSKKNTTKF